MLRGIETLTHEGTEVLPSIERGEENRGATPIDPFPPRDSPSRETPDSSAWFSVATQALEMKSQQMIVDDATTGFLTSFYSLPGSERGSSVAQEETTSFLSSVPSVLGSAARRRNHLFSFVRPFGPRLRCLLTCLLCRSGLRRFSARRHRPSLPQTSLTKAHQGKEHGDRKENAFVTCRKCGKKPWIS